MKNKLLIMLIVFGLSVAFTSHLPAKFATDKTWYYIGSGSTTDPSNYALSDGTMCQQGTTHICSIVAPEDSTHPGQPDISAALATRIENKDTSMGDVFLRR